MSHRREKDKCHKNQKKDKKCNDDITKIKDLCVKRLNAVDIKTKTITGATGTFTNLTVENATVNNLNATTINGIDFDCLNSSFNISGVITPVEYVNGEPVQPDNPGNFNQDVLDDLWTFNQLANAVTNADANSGRLRNAILNNFYGCTGCPAPNISDCVCPVPGYAVFTGSIAANSATGATGTTLTVSAILSESLTDCSDIAGTLEVGQMIFLENTNQQFFASTIVSQLTGVTGGAGTYLIHNNFNNYTQVIGSQRMLALFNLTPLEDCANVPLRIYGVETLSVGPTGPCNHLIDAIAYNINIANKTLQTKLAAVYVQLGWKAPGATGAADIQGISIDTKQFDPSILSFGEQMNNNVLLPTDLITNISFFNRLNDEVNAVVQLAVYVEDGLEVLIPESGSSSSSSMFQTRAIGDVSSPNSNFAASFDSLPCRAYIPIFDGVLETYVQPFFGESVDVLSNFGDRNTFIGTKGTTLFTEGGVYIVDHITPPGFLNFINTGYIGNAPVGTVIPGPTGAIGPINSTWQGVLGQIPFPFIHPAVGQSTFVTISAPSSCISIILNNDIIVTNVIGPTGAIGPDLLIAIYTVTAINPTTTPNLFTVIILNPGTNGVPLFRINPAPGTLFESISYVSLPRLLR